ncbi:MAG: alcohol dehydrogenase catalytic domain-containing protein [Clostridia bacterium]|nr:alcohol dehydrogenase catalytic domain-containing protein [Clostridia bacterium]
MTDSANVKTAKAAVFQGAQRPFEVREYEIVATPKGYGRSELIASGVCGTDLHIARGTLAVPAGSIIGHEFVGKLTDCDPDDAAEYGLKVGDNVIADIAVPCGKCLLCLSGDDANCVNMQVTNEADAELPPHLHGGYAEVNFTPLTNLVKIPENIDPFAAAVFACPGPTAIHAFRLGAGSGYVPDKETVAVVQGLGPVGCFAIVYLRAMGVKKLYAVTGKDNPEKRRLALALGADEVLSLQSDGAEAVTKKLQAENGGIGVDLCFEASGAPSAIPLGIDILRNRGTYLVPGQYSNSGGIEIQPQLITFKALRIIGSSQYSMIDVKDYLAFLGDHPETQPLIRSLATAYPVSQVNIAFRDALAGRNVKTVLVK